MAAMIRLGGEINTLISGVYDKKNEAEYSRQIEFAAAVKIQSWFRAVRVRAYLKYLNKCATRIQKVWRGYLGRRFCRVLLKNTLFIMKLNHYNKMACRVQKTWRGYYARKYVFNYHSRKRYLEALHVKNELIRSELAEFAEHQSLARKREEEKSEKQRKEYEARKHHYLVSTAVKPGIYNSPFLPNWYPERSIKYPAMGNKREVYVEMNNECDRKYVMSYPTETEFLLRNVQPLPHQKKKIGYCNFDPTCARYNSQVPKTLPPLVKKPQGPFREPDEVQKQRYKPFRPTLRVATEFYSLEKARKQLKEEEWVTRLNDNILQPFTHRTLAYEPLLYTSSKFGPVKYGTRFFREEFPEKFIFSQDFKSQVPPIPLFDRLNDTYSKGQEV